MPGPLILASASLGRAGLLKTTGLPFEIKPADIDETPHADEAPGDYVLRLAVEKANAIAEQNPTATVIAADTVVVVGSEILQKPADRHEAKQQLLKQLGKMVTVLSGWCVYSPNQTESGVDASHIEMRELHPRELDALLDETVNWQNRSGGWGIQVAPQLFSNVNGDVSSIIGLPLNDVTSELKAVGYDV